MPASQTTVDEDYEAFLTLIEKQRREACVRSSGMLALQVAEADLIAAGEIDPDREELVRFDLAGDEPVALVQPLEGLDGTPRNLCARK